MAYITPAIMAGIGGVVTSNRGLQIGALITIGGASALIAWMIGFCLRSKGRHTQWITRAPRLMIVVGFALAGFTFGLLAAGVTSSVLGVCNLNGSFAWSNRIWVNSPLSGTIACTIITCRTVRILNRT